MPRGGENGEREVFSCSSLPWHALSCVCPHFRERFHACRCPSAKVVGPSVPRCGLTGSYVSQDREKVQEGEVPQVPQVLQKFSKKFSKKSFDSETDPTTTWQSRTSREPRRRLVMCSASTSTTTPHKRPQRQVLFPFCLFARLVGAMLCLLGVRLVRLPPSCFLSSHQARASRQTGRQTDKQADRQTDRRRQTETTNTELDRHRQIRQDR